MTPLAVFIFTSIIYVTTQSCPGIDGGYVPWWILYQQKERPFIHYYVDSTNKEDIVVHYPEKENSVLARVIHPLIVDDSSQYFIYLSDFVNAAKIANSLGKPTHSKWMHGILATDTSWTSGTWLLSNNLLFPPTKNGNLVPPTANQWTLSTIGDSGEDIFYVCISAENRNDIDNILQTILAGNPFIFTQKLNKDAFIQLYLQDIQTTDTSFGLEQSENMFLDCMYATSNETMQKCLYRYSVDEGLAVQVFTRPRGMTKHSRTFCHKTDSKGLYEFGVQENTHSNNPDLSNSMFVLSDQSNSGTTGKVCFGQDIGAYTEAVAIMICVQLPKLYKNLIELSKISSCTCQNISLNENQESLRTKKTSLLPSSFVHFSKTGQIRGLHYSVTEEADETHRVKQSTSNKQQEQLDENNEDVPYSAVDSGVRLQKNDYTKLCTLLDCSGKLKKQHAYKKKIYKDQIKKFPKIDGKYDEMVNDVQMVEKNDERKKTNKAHATENPGSSSSGMTCSDPVAKEYACKILALHNTGRIVLWDRHPSGVHDNAYAYNNIRDSCHGLAASRSHYNCSECRNPGAPGGHVCLYAKLLQYIDDIGSSGYIHVNEIAGACHSCKSLHYEGRAVDLHLGRNKLFMSKCSAYGGNPLDEGNHIHCQFRP